MLEMLYTLQTRFEQNQHRHAGITWAKVQARLEKSPSACWSLNEMEDTGGEPDVVGLDKKTGAYIFSIAPRRAQPGAEAYVTTARGLSRERNISPKLVP